jgi:formylglycine-generating enzyme required for sulfatase activity
MFVAMELLTGRTLQQLLDDEGALPPARALSIAGQLLAALATAHAGGVIHADVTPSNIFVQDGAPERVVLLDFGLSRLRAATAVAAIGGTPAFMAPEQLRSGRVDASSDLYAAGLVIAAMLTGQRPEAPGALATAVDAIEDASLRAVVHRALAEDPADRFASATDMALALPGDPVSLAYPARPPFRPAPFVEAEHADFFGRDREIDVLLEHVLFRRAMIYVAPSGTGKTSLLRAGLSPRLEKLGVRTVYVACRTGLPHGLAEAIDPDATDIVESIARRHATGARRLVVLIDQVEAALHDATQNDTVVEQLGLARWPADVQASVVLSVREEYLARLLDRTQRIEPGIPIVRLGPLTSLAARDVMVRTLAARGLTIEPALVDELIADLEHAAARLAGELGWGSAAAIYPPHLQLAGAMLYEARPASATEIPLALYRQLGGLDKIVAEHLYHVLEGELSGDSTAIARDLLLALVTSSHTRTARAESELIAIALRAESTASGAALTRTADAVRGVIAFLRDRGLIVALPGRPPDPKPLWDLAHDSLVPRIEAWITSRDLARLRALELVRYHLRRSDAQSLSLLGPDELREVAGNLRATDLAALDQDWARPDRGVTPATRLVAASRRAIRGRRIAVVGTITAAIAIATLLGVRWRDEREARLRETRLRDRDIGHFVLDLDAFDWDAATLTATAVPRGGALALDWELREPVDDDEDSPGAAMAGDDLAREALPPIGVLRADLVAARGGPAVLVVHRRDPAEDAAFCRDVLVTMRRLPGYAAAGAPVPHLAVRVPSCAATRAGMIEIPAGPFIAGGQGDPPTPYRDDELPREAVVDLPRYWIDRTEVTLGAMHQFAALRPLHGIAEPAHPPDHTRYPTDPPYPVTAINWREARAFCRFFGKDLPTLDQWDKALRGGTKIGDVPNPCPRRNFAWCGDMHPGWANMRIGDLSQQKPVGSFRHDVSPYGVADLVGSVQEWTRSPDLPYAEFPADLTAAERHRRQTLPGAMMITRGCNWGDFECETAPLTIMPIPNARLRDFRYFTFGMRCAL